MAEKNLDFDTVIDRKNTNCLKYDFAIRRGKPENVLPLWIADMDYKISQDIIDALQSRVAHGIFGYSEVKDEYFEALQQWMKEKHDWEIERRWLVKTPGVVFALAMAVKAFTEPGGGVMIQQPVYYPFSEVIRDNDREVIVNALYLGEDGKYHMDLEDFEQKVIQYKIKLFYLCSPHNPVGRVWTREELKALGDICVKHQVIVVSDEIHQDFVYRGKHQVFAAISEEIREITITCTSPSKTFNVAGLQISNIFIANPTLKKAFRKQVDATGYSQLNTLGLTACEAAYRNGGEWHEQLMEYLKANIAYLKHYLAEKLPQIKLIEPEGTYLMWLDFRELKLTEVQREKLIVEKAGLWLDSGAIFGEAGEGFERINIACSRRVLKTALDRLASAIEAESN